MAPPSILPYYEDLEKNSYPHQSSSLSSFFLSASPSVANNNCCSKSFASPMDHDYFMNLDNMMDSPSTTTVSLKDAFGCPAVQDNNNEVMTLVTEGRMPTCCSPSSHGDSPKVKDYVCNNDVSLVKEGETPLSHDMDFLHDLDDLDFDFVDLDSCRDVTLENNFQNFIDATLDVGFVHDSNNNCGLWNLEQEVEEEDLYKKEFFMKHLGLGRVSPRLTQRKHRKRKLDEDFPNSCTTMMTSSSPLLEDDISSCSHPSQHISDNSFTVLSSSNKIHIVSCNNTLPASTQSSSSPSVNTTCSTTPTTHTVPYKLCSCAAGDWQRSILYSTAKCSSVSSVQTSPSTASTLSRSHRKMTTVHLAASLSPSDIFQEVIKDRLEVEFLDRGELDEDTEELLQWLDNDQIKTSMCGDRSMGVLDEVCSFTLKQNTTNHSTTSQTTSDAIVLEPEVSGDNDRSQRHQQEFATQDMESFIDLEYYVTEESAPILDSAPFDTYVSRHVNPTSNKSVASLSNPQTAMISQKSHLRLSILADISNDLLPQRDYNETKDDIQRDIIKSCHSNSSADENFVESPAVHYSSHFLPSECSSEDSVFSSSPYSSSSFSGSVTSDFASSPSSLSSPTSPSFTTPPHSHPNKSLDILNLFSDENSQMLLGGCDLSLSIVRFM